MNHELLNWRERNPLYLENMPRIVEDVIWIGAGVGAGTASYYATKSVCPYLIVTVPAATVGGLLTTTILQSITPIKSTGETISLAIGGILWGVLEGIKRTPKAIINTPKRLENLISTTLTNFPRERRPLTYYTNQEDIRSQSHSQYSHL